MEKHKNAIIVFSVVIVSLITMVQCKNEKREKDKSIDKNELKSSGNIEIDVDKYGTTPNGENVDEYTLRNNKGMEVKVITYGGRITSLKVPNKEGDFENVVLGFETLNEYVEDNPFFGALIGRYGNRIAHGKFSLEEQEYTLAQNDGENHLHGGELGFDKVVWDAEETDENSLRLEYLSKDMEEGYPGNLKVVVLYTLTENNELKVAYEATTDKTTIVNLTQHAYFNLSGDFSTSITDHEVEINADDYLPIDETLIPTGEFKKVGETPFDFRKPKLVGEDIDKNDDQLTYGAGYDHCWVLNKNENNQPSLAAALYHKESGRFLEVETTEPGIQFYSGNLIDEGLSVPGSQETYPKRSGLCLETQHYPDSPNQEDFPSVILEPDETFSSQTIFKFSVK